MVQTSYHRLVVAFFIALIAIVAACEDNPPDTYISQFDRPQDVALVCVNSYTLEPLHIDCCRPENNWLPAVKNEECKGNFSRSRVRLISFVTQTTPGEVAVVDLWAQKIIDQEASIPYNSFVPVGGQPSDIAATRNGQWVYTANYETGDLSVINVHTTINNPALTPSKSIYLGGPAARLALARNPQNLLDRYAFVTQPTEGRLAVVALDHRSCAEDSPSGCLLGYLRIHAGTGYSGPPLDEDAGPGTESDAGMSSDPDGVRPWAIVASEITDSLYVSGTDDDGDFILELSAQILVHEAEEQYSQSSSAEALSENAVIRRIETPGHRMRSLALEPDPEFWLYAIEHESGGVVAIDLVNGKMAEVEDGNYVLDLGEAANAGRARAIAMFRVEEKPAVLSEDDDEDEVDDNDVPLTFNGAFAVVSTTTAGIFIIDVNDANAHPLYPKSHHLRSGVDLQSDDSDDLPHIEERPTLTVGSETIAESQIYKYAFLEYPDSGVDSGLDAGDPGDGGAPEVDDFECGPDSGAVFKPETDFGIQFRCDPYRWSREQWTLTWQGAVGISGAATIIDALTTTEVRVIQDETKNFCQSGLRPRTPSIDGYPGDFLTITSKPTSWPDDSETCETIFGEGKELIYRVERVEKNNEEYQIVINDSVPNPVPLPEVDCFGQAFSYEIRASDQWVLRGSRSGNLYDGMMVESDGGIECRPGPREAEGRTQRVWPGEEFENYYLRFTVTNRDYFSDAGLDGEQVAEDEETTTETEDVYFQFSTVGGYVPLYAVIGNNVSDLVFTPDLDLVMVDQDSEGLIVFDLLDQFAVIGNSVN